MEMFVKAISGNIEISHLINQETSCSLAFEISSTELFLNSIMKKMYHT